MSADPKLAAIRVDGGTMVAGVVARLQQLEAERDELVAALRLIADQPIGDPKSNDRAVLEGICEIARAALRHVALNRTQLYAPSIDRRSREDLHE